MSSESRLERLGLLGLEGSELLSAIDARIAALVDQPSSVDVTIALASLRLERQRQAEYRDQSG